jgi:hypothetical protein
MSARSRTLAILVPVALVDVVIPIPILGILMIYVLLARPPWFRSLVDDVYGRS